MAVTAIFCTLFLSCRHCPECRWCNLIMEHDCQSSRVSAKVQARLYIVHISRSQHFYVRFKQFLRAINFQLTSDFVSRPNSSRIVSGGSLRISQLTPFVCSFHPHIHQQENVYLLSFWEIDLEFKVDDSVWGGLRTGSTGYESNLAQSRAAEGERNITARNHVFRPVIFWGIWWHVRFSHSATHFPHIAETLAAAVL